MSRMLLPLPTRSGAITASTRSMLRGARRSKTDRHGEM